VAERGSTDSVTLSSFPQHARNAAQHAPHNTRKHNTRKHSRHCPCPRMPQLSLAAPLSRAAAIKNEVESELN